MNYEILVKEVLACLGGKENILSHTHCVTRLRFQLADRSIVKKEAIEEIEGVLGVMDKGGIFQVIIGPEVDKAYVFVKKLVPLGNDEPTETKKSKAKPHEAVLNYISASLAPTLPALTFAGFVLVILNLLTTFGLMDNTTPTYTILNTFANAAIYYLPVFVAIGAARRLKANEISAALLALVVLHPNFLGLETKELFGISLMNVTYNGNIIPMMLTVPIYAFLEKKCNDYIPQLVRSIFKPLISILVSAIVLVTITGPIGTYISQLFANLVVTLSNYGAISIGIMTFVNPILVLTGMHTVLLPLGFNEITTLGYTTILARGLPYNMAVAGATLGVAYMSKNKADKDNALSSGIMALFGTSEPALFGTLVRLRTPFIATMCGGGIAGIVAGLVKLKLFVPTAPSLLTLPAFISADYSSNIMWAIVVSAIAFVASFIISCIFTKKEG